MAFYYLLFSLDLLLFHCQEVSADRERLNEFQCRLVDLYLLEAKLNGIDFTGIDRKKFLERLRQLVDSKNHFRSCLENVRLKHENLN